MNDRARGIARSVVILFLLSGAVLGESLEFSPPYTDIAAMEKAIPVSWLVGDAGYYAVVDEDAGTIVQSGIAYAIGFGGGGVRVANVLTGEFTVPVSGEYTIQFSGNVSRLLHSVGETAIAGYQKAVFNIEINAGIKWQTIFKETIYETDLSPSAYLKEVVSIAVSEALDAAIPAGKLKTGIEVWNAVNDINNALPDITVDIPFTVTATYQLDAGSHVWWFDLRSDTIATALGLSAMYATSIVNCSLESITITPLADHYRITPSSGPNGSIEPHEEILVVEGADIGFRATPNDGYRVSKWYLNDQEVVERGGHSAFLLTDVDDDTRVRVTFTDADVSEPSGNWQNPTILGLVEGERTWPSVYLSAGNVHYYRLTMSATGTERDYAGILIKGSGTDSGDLDVSLGRVNNNGSFVPATGRWANVSTSWNNNDIYPHDSRAEVLSLDGFGPGEYYVIVYGASGLDGDEALERTNVNFAGTESGEYNLWIRGPMIDSYEMDDTAEYASQIQTDSIPQHHTLPGSDVDWIKFQLNQLSEVIISTNVVLGDLNTNDLGLHISLFGPDASNTVITTDYDGKGDATISRQGDNSLAPGMYYVRTESDTQNDIRDYTIGVMATPRILPNISPITPDATVPLDGATGVSLTPTLESSDFSDWDSGDAHQASHWQVAMDSDFAFMVWDSGETVVDKTSVAVSEGHLGYATTYYWRVRHQDDSGIFNSWSGWSAVSSFTTIPKACQLTVTIDPTEGGVATGGGSYSYGEIVTLTASPAAGYRVASWIGTDDDTSTANSNTATMTSDKTVSVQFELIPSTPQALSIEVADSADPVDANDQVTYTITYGNTGQLDASNTVIAAVLPSGVSFVSTSGGGTYNTSARTVTWNIGSLAGETTGQTVSFVVSVDGSMADGGTITHSQLTIDCDETEPVTAVAETTTVNDTKSPQVSGRSPVADSEMAARDGLITLHVTDAGSGVRYDGGTVTIRIEGDLIYDGAHETSAGEYNTQSSSQTVKGVCRRSGTVADYTFTFTPTTEFDFEQLVDVVVTVADVADNTDTVSYSFWTVTRSFGENGKVNSDESTLAQDHPATAVDSAGNIWVVWDQQTIAGDTDIYIGKLTAGGDAFGPSTAVYRRATNQSYPVIAVDRNDKLYVAWQSQAANGNWDVCVSRSNDGIFWTEPVVVNVGDPNNTSSQRHPSIAANSQAPGTIYVAYDDYRAGSGDVWVATSTNGTTWTETRITTDAADQILPRVFIDQSDGTAYVFWTDARDTATQGMNIYAASSQNAWNNAAVVATANNENSAVGAAYDTIYLAWVSNNGTLENVQYGDDAGGLPTTGTAIGDEPGVTQAAPSLALRHDARGAKVFAAWQDGRDDTGNGDTDIYFAESGSPFGTNILVNDDAGTAAQTAPAIGVDSGGNPYVVWVDERNGNKDIYYAGATSIGDPMPTTVVTTGNKVTVRAAAQANLEVEIPQMPSGVKAEEVTIAQVSNPPQMPSGTNEVGLKYEFGPSGLQFATPATLRIPLTTAGSYDSYRVFRYDPNDLMSPSFPWTESGIHNPATLVAGAGGTYLEVQVDHFSIYGAAGIAISSDGGGGGGCALSPYGEGSPTEFMLPYVMYVLVLLGMKRADKRRTCR